MQFFSVSLYVQEEGSFTFNFIINVSRGILSAKDIFKNDGEISFEQVLCKTSSNTQLRAILPYTYSFRQTGKNDDCSLGVHNI